MKRRLLSLLEEDRLDQVSDLAGKHKRVLSLLTGLTYHADPLIAQRAVLALGQVARRVAQDDPEYVRVHLRRLLWLLNDESGAIGWRAPEAAGEIIANCPGQFDEFISPLLTLLDMQAGDAPRFRPGLLYAARRIAETNPQAVRPVLPLIEACLDDPDPQVRRLAGECLQKVIGDGSRLD